LAQSGFRNVNSLGICTERDESRSRHSGMVSLYHSGKPCQGSHSDPRSGLGLYWVWLNDILGHAAVPRSRLNAVVVELCGQRVTVTLGLAA